MGGECLRGNVKKGRMLSHRRFKKQIITINYKNNNRDVGT